MIKNVSRKFVKFFFDNKAVTAVEYALIVAAIVIAIIAAVKLVGTNSSATFNNVATAI